MNCLFIFERHNPQYGAFYLFDYSPKSETVILLRFHFDRIFANADTPFLLEIRSFPEHFIFEVFCKSISFHSFNEDNILLKYL